MVIGMTLHNMTVEDRRIRTMGRYFRSIVSQLQNEDEGDRKQDVFRLTYDKSYNGDREIDFELGSPQVVIIPDILPDLSNFITIDEPEKEDTKKVSFVEESKDEEEVIEDIQEMDVCVHCSDTSIEAAFGSKQQLVTTKYTLKTLNCRFVMVDMGSEMLLDLKHKTISKFGTSAEITETFVLQGKMNTVFETTSDLITGESYKRDLDVRCECIEIYTAQGHGLLFPTQILEPTSLNLLLYMENAKEQHITLKFFTPTSIDLIISMQNIALMNAIVSSITDYSNDTETEEEVNIADNREMSVIESSRVRALSVALQKDSDDWNFITEGNDINVSKLALVEDGEEAKIDDNKRIISFVVILSQASLTIINDMQGLDTALLKVISQNTASKGEMITTDQQNDMKFDFDFTSAFLIDYFDLSSNLWENFLLKPFEFSLHAERKLRSNINVSKSRQMVSAVDFESNPCSISFSEQLLVSLGAASSMWSAYSNALQPAEQDVKKSKDKLQETIKRSIARSFVTSSPYALKNLIGVDVSFNIKFGDENTESPRHTCAGGQIEYFQFESSQSKGVGIKRLYGQDVKYKKSLEIQVGDDVIFIDHIDQELNNERQAHLIGDLIVFSEVIRAGATTVSTLIKVEFSHH